MFRGFTTISYFADDLDAAAAWYTEFLGVAPYFRSGDGYVEFRIGDYQHELGIVNRKYVPGHESAGGVLMYWAVDDLEAVVARLLALGATAHLPITSRGDGYVTASVYDPFGNILGVMTNQHYLDVLATISAQPAPRS